MFSHQFRTTSVTDTNALISAEKHTFSVVSMRFTKKVTLCTFFTRNHTPKLDETVEEHHHIGKEEQYYGAFIFETISFHRYFDRRS